MSVISKASLVLIPSGYGEGKLYSEVPNTAAGDFTFTRASTGTRVNSDGYIEEVPCNLITYSEDYLSGFWSKSNTTIIANDIISPRGLQDASKIYPNSSGNYRHIRNALFSQSSGLETFSIYAKAGELDHLVLIDYDGSGVGIDFDLTNGVATDNASTPFDSFSMTDVGDGWYRCEATATDMYFYWILSDNGGLSVTANGTDGLFIWGAMINKGTSVKPYIKTTDRLDIPRLDYSGGASCPTLLLEGQRTNIATYSEDYTQSFYIKDSGITATLRQEISPTGLNDATKISVTNNGRIYANHTTGTYATSVFIKAGTFSNFKVQGQNVDLGVSPIVTGSLDSEDFGNGWYRLTGYYTGIRSFQVQAYPDNTYLPHTDSGDYYLFGTQIESGSYPTSYIPTSGTSVTRVADVCSLTNIIDLIGQTEGVIFIDFELQTTLESFALMNIYNTLTPINGINFFFNTSGVLNAICYNSGYQAIIASGVLSEGRFKAAFAYKENDFAFYLNGSLIGIDTLGTVPTCDALRLENYQNSPAFQEKTKVYQAQIYKTRLSNSELETLTTI